MQENIEVVKYVAKCYIHDKTINASLVRCATDEKPFRLYGLQVPARAYLIELFEKVLDHSKKNPIEKTSEARHYYIGKKLEVEDLIRNSSVGAEELEGLKMIQCNGFVKVASGRYYPLYNGDEVLDPKDFVKGVYTGKVEDEVYEEYGKYAD